MWVAICVIGVTSGIATSLLSGSKSGWISFVLVPIGFLLYLPKVRAWTMTRFGVITVVSALLLSTLALTLTPAGQRLSQGYSGIQDYFATGEVTEGSVGPRLEMWAYGASMVPQAPILGIGKRAMEQDMQSRAKSGEYAPILAHLHTLHNEFLYIFVINGVIGFAALLWVYVEVFRLSKRRGQTGPSSGPHMALGLVLIYLSLGVGEVAIQLEDLRNIFLFWVLILAGQSSVSESPNKTKSTYPYSL